MKLRPSLPALLAIATLPSLSLRAQDKEEALSPAAVDLKLDDEPAAGKDPAVKDASPGSANQDAETEAKIIAALPKADQERLRELVRDASTFVAGIRLQEAFEKLLEAEAIAPDLFTVHNLKGAAYTKMRDFKKARASFEKAISIAPTAFMGRFNLAETEFVTHNYEVAVKGFTPLIDLLEQQAKQAEKDAADPKKPLDAAQRKGLLSQAMATRGTIKLIQYKLLICCLKTDDAAGAAAIQKTFHNLDDDPAFYYGNAAIAFDKADRLKGDEKAVKLAQEEAQEWLRSAERIYNRQQLEIYTDSLIESGWIDNLQ